MQLTPKTEAELAADRLLPDGIYPFECLRASEGVSKSGNPMITVELRIYCDSGEVILRDYLLSAYLRKILNFCKVTGLIAKYNAGALSADDCAGKTGFVKIGKEDGREMTDKKTGASYNPPRYFDPKNTVKDYAVNAEGAAPGITGTTSAGTKPQPTAAQMANQTSATADDDSIPF